MTQEEKLIELVKSKLPQLLREDEEFRRQPLKPGSKPVVLSISSLAGGKWML